MGQFKEKCLIKGCKNKYYGKGYCIEHYYRIRRYGDPLHKIRTDHSNTCKIIGCNNKYFCKDFCNKHYKRFKNHGDPQKILKPNGGKKRSYIICKVENCNNFARGKGLCNLHYRRLRKHGDVNKTLINRGEKLKCRIIHCNFKAHTFCMCLKHYKQQYCKNNPEKIHQRNIKVYEKLGSILKLNYRQYKWALQSWSEVVRKRDNHTCQICGIRDEKLNIAHHIFYRSLMPKLSLNISNGITLCRKCHYEVHWGKKY